MPHAPLDAEQRITLLQVALEAIRSRLESRPDVIPEVDAVADPVLRAPGASFVTLERGDALLGCIGSLAPNRPLAVGVAHHALSAAFADPRLPPVTVEDYSVMSVKVSVLGSLVPVPAASLADLIAAVRPSVDGLVVTSGRQRATLLPSVWRDLAEPARFLEVLWAKAGLAPGTWPSDIGVARYTTQEFAEPGPRAPILSR